MQDKNFSGQANLTLSDKSFHRCNFTQLEPRFSGGKWRGIQIFADNLPRTFVECNLCNVEPPPGSLVKNCLVIVKLFDVLEDDKVFDIAYGFWDEKIDDYVYFDVPKKMIKKVGD